LKFCTKTKGFSEEQNKEFAKDLKDFTKKEAEKFRDRTKEPEEETEAEEN
jgi:mRNA-degrading endonuclease RelE of RelBE toxin-antitoxin system